MPETTPSAAPFRDRAVRLVSFGSIAVLAGGVCLALGLLQLLLPALGDLLPADAAAAADPRSALMGALVYAALGVAFVWVGLGSIRKRRWVRSFMLILAWTWLAGGLLGTVLLAGMVEGALAITSGGREPLAEGIVRLVQLLVLGASLVFGVLLPGLFVAVYQDRNLQKTCEARDPKPSWTESCPVSVLGLSAGLGAAAVLALPLAVRPAFPFFGRIVTGWPGGVLLLAGAAACVWLARSTFRLEITGWWASTALLVVAGVSTAMTLQATGLIGLYRAMGYPEEQLAMLEEIGLPGRSLMAGTTLLLTVLTAVFMVAIRKHFVPRSTR